MLTARIVNRMNRNLDSVLDIDVFVAKFNAVLVKYEINTIPRQIHFFTQLLSESSLELKAENLNYSAARLPVVWPSRFNKANASQYTYNPMKLANEVYANRLGNGTVASGDGYKYRGRGYIQLTGKSNYEHYGKATGFDLVANPDLMMQIGVAAIVSGEFWDQHNLNSYADRGDIASITTIINGSARTVPERTRLLATIKRIYVP